MNTKDEGGSVKDELQLDELFASLPHADRICELYGNCTCGRDEEILKIKSALFTHIARLRKIEAAARTVVKNRPAPRYQYHKLLESIEKLAATLNESEPK